MHWLICLLPLFVITYPSTAIPLTSWNFAANNGDEASVNATVVAGGFQTTAITRGGTQSPQVSPGSFSNASWPFTSTPDAYFQFGVNPQSGTTFTITDIDFGFVLSRLGPVNWILRSDADGYTADLDTWFSVVSHNSVLPANADFQNLTGPRTFRLYGLNSSGGGAGLTTLSINGTLSTTAVPETLPAGVFGLTITLLLFARSRVKS